MGKFLAGGWGEVGRFLAGGCGVEGKLLKAGSAWKVLAGSLAGGLACCCGSCSLTSWNSPKVASGTASMEGKSRAREVSERMLASRGAKEGTGVWTVTQ